ncbi:MAG: hypothetical protein AB8G11_12335 [Saprospiraceae bacterium]
MKYTILLFLIFITSLNLNAQQNKIGVRYGLGWHFVNGKTFSNTPNLGSIISFNYELERSNKTYFQFEISYEERGFQTEKMIFENQEAYLKFNYNYLAFPVKWGFKSRSEGRSYMSGRFGLVPSVLLSAKTKEILFGEVNTMNVTDRVS